MNNFQKHILCNVFCATNTVMVLKNMQIETVSQGLSLRRMTILQCPSSEQWVQYTSVSPVTFIKNRETTPQQTSQEKKKHIISNESKPRLERFIRLQQWTCVSSVNSNHIKESEWPNKRFWSPALPLQFCSSLRNSTWVCYVQYSLLMPKYPVESMA